MRLSLAAWICLAGVSVLSADTVLKTGNLTADARVIALVNNDGNESVNALGIGANAFYDHTINENYRLGVGIAFGAPLSESDDGIAAQQLNVELSESGKSSDFFSLNQFYLHYLQSQYDVKIGRVVLDTPLAASDDHWRLNKNSFEAVVGSYKVSESFHALAAYIRSFSGIDSTALNSNGSTARDDFNSMSDAAFGVLGYNKDQVDNAGVMTLAALYGEEALKTQGWLYYMPEIEAGGLKTSLTAFYGDLDWVSPMGRKGELSVSLQAYHIGLSKDFDTATHNVGGLKVTMTSLADMLDFTAALNMVSGDGAIMNLWGAYPEYAAGSEVFLTGLSEGMVAKLGARMNMESLLENAILDLNVIMLDGDMSDYGPDSSALFGEIVLAYAPDKQWDTSLTIVTRSGDAEGYKALAKAAYAF